MRASVTEIELYLEAEVPPQVAAECCRKLLRERPARIALAGRSGSGKSTVAAIIRMGEWPCFNHADTMKGEVFDWLVDALERDADPDASFLRFANFMGLSPNRVRSDLWELLGPVYQSFLSLRHSWRETGLPISPGLAPEERLHLVEQHKPLFREALQLYGEMCKEIAADPYHWVKQTVDRSVGHPVCFNADTRFSEEMETLRNCGWTGIYLAVSDEKQRLRRPELTETQRNHASEWGIGPEECDLVVDADRPLGAVLMQIANYLSGKERA